MKRIVCVLISIIVILLFAGFSIILDGDVFEKFGGFLFIILGVIGLFGDFIFLKPFIYVENKTAIIIGNGLMISLGTIYTIYILVN